MSSREAESAINTSGSGDVPGSTWWSEGLAFSCTGCGRCCRGAPGYVWLTDDEVCAIASYLGEDEASFRSRCLRSAQGRTSLRERKNFDCIFLERGSGCEDPDRCSIYGVRPLQCRLFPFWPSLLESREAWNEQASRCPGMNRDRLRSADEIADLLDSSPWPDL